VGRTTNTPKTKSNFELRIWHTAIWATRPLAPAHLWKLINSLREVPIRGGYHHQGTKDHQVIGAEGGQQLVKKIGPASNLGQQVDPRSQPLHA